MLSPVLDFADARNRMVDSQVRPNKVTDPRILTAMRRLPRERFLPPALVSLAYSDTDVPLGGGRVLLEPMVIARLIQAASPRPGERALVVASGAGYGAAVLSACGPAVTALEEDAALLALARPVLADFAPGVVVVTGKLADGWAAGEPWDIILIEGGVKAVPPAIGAQLRRDGGRLVTVLAGPGRTGQAVLGELTPAGLRMQPVFDCTAALLPSLLPAPGFVF